ncbi:MAG TPA: hypothetical protein VGI92_07150 [Gemmatimonadales bacterium]|jgi:hypothetical protein
MNWLPTGCISSVLLFALGCGSVETTETPPSAPRPPHSLAFVSEPTLTAAGCYIAAGIEVDVVDSTGTWVPSATDQISILLTDSRSDDTLATIQAVNGIVRLDSIAPKRWGSGFRVVATAPGLQPAVSDTFSILPPPGCLRQARARRMVATRSEGR